MKVTRSLAMKRVVISALAAVFASASIAGADNVDITAKLTNFKPSHNVRINYGVTAVTGQDYVINSKHLAGDTVYGSSSKATKTYFRTGVAGTALEVATEGSVVPGECFETGWKQQ